MQSAHSVKQIYQFLIFRRHVRKANFFLPLQQAACETSDQSAYSDNFLLIAWDSGVAPRFSEIIEQWMHCLDHFRIVIHLRIYPIHNFSGWNECGSTNVHSSLQLIPARSNRAKLASQNFQRQLVFPIAWLIQNDLLRQITCVRELPQVIRFHFRAQPLAGLAEPIKDVSLVKTTPLK